MTKEVKYMAKVMKVMAGIASYLIFGLLILTMIDAIPSIKHTIKAVLGLLD